MTIRVSPVYENGVLRLKDALGLPEGTPVQVLVIDEKRPSANGQSPSVILSDIAALPMEPGGQEFTGREHDWVRHGIQTRS